MLFVGRSGNGGDDVSVEWHSWGGVVIIRLLYI